MKFGCWIKMLYLCGNLNNEKYAFNPITMYLTAGSGYNKVKRSPGSVPGKQENTSKFSKLKNTRAQTLWPGTFCSCFYKNYVPVG